MNWRALFRRDAIPLVNKVSGFYDNGGTSTSPAEWLLNLNRGGPTVSGEVIDEWIAEGMPAVYACTRAISETVGQLPLKLYKRTDQGRDEADTHPLYALLHDLPNPEMTAYQFREMLTRHLAMWGRAYAFIQRADDGEVIALWPVHPLRVKVKRDGVGRKVFIVSDELGMPQEFPFNPVRPPFLHLHMNSDQGLDGRSPIWINRESLGITKAAENYVGAWFGNGAIPGVVLTHPGKLSKNAMEHVRENWLKRFLGARKGNSLAILPEDVKVNVVGVEPQKSQLRELREDQISAAARIWRVPSFIIQNHTKETSWGSGIEQMMIGWINTGLMPYFTQWEQAISRDLISQKSYRTHYAKFVTAALERGDLKTTMDALSIGRINTILSANEAREKLDMNDLPGKQGDSMLIPSGTQVLGKDGQPVTPEPKEPTANPAEPKPDPTEPKAKPVAGTSKGVN